MGCHEMQEHRRLLGLPTRPCPGDAKNGTKLALRTHKSSNPNMTHALTKYAPHPGTNPRTNAISEVLKKFRKLNSRKPKPIRPPTNFISEVFEKHKMSKSK